MQRRIKKTTVLRARAVQQVETMVPEVEDILRREMLKTQGGLVVHCALFGNLPPSDVIETLCEYSKADRWIAVGAPYIDVTLATQLHFDKVGKLPTGMASKCDLEGWFDPCPEFKHKKIFIAYTCRGESAAHIYEADEEVKIENYY